MKKQTKQKEIAPPIPEIISYKKLSIALAILILILGVATTYDYQKDKAKDKKQSPMQPEDLCSIISGTPSWAMDYKIIDGGYKPGLNTSEAVDFLIQNQIYFLYSPYCGWCQKQIQEFGQNWQHYQESGLTIDCYSVLNERRQE